MKKALVIGGGSENGRVILDTLADNDYDVVNFGSSIYQRDGVATVPMDWHHVDIEFVHRNFSRFEGVFDFVFFNQNSSSLNARDFSIQHDDILETWRRIKDWNHSYWISCQMPFLVLHTIRKNLCAESKVGWMLSTLIDHSNPASAEFADYSSNKYFNYLSMKSFAQANQFKTFGIYPTFSKPDSKDKLKHIVNTVINNDVDHTEFKF